MFDERGEPTDAQYIAWNEENDANDDGRAVAEAERDEAEMDHVYSLNQVQRVQEGYEPAPETHLGYNPHTDRYETGGDEVEFADESD